MKTLFTNANIYSQGKFIFGSVGIDDNKIVFVGDIPTNFVADRTIDVKKNILMSGFVNAHAHTPSTVLRGICDDKPLADWLDTIIPFEQKMTNEDIYWSVMLGIAEYVAGGITSVMECFTQIEPIVKAYKNAGFRASIAIGYPNCGETQQQDIESQCKFVENNGFTANCYAHSIYGIEERFFDELNSYAHKNNLPVSTHLSETLKEVGDCTVKYNLTPVELLEDYGFLDRKCTLYHLVHADKDDLEILSNYEVNVVTCPSSNIKLASGIAPIYAMQRAGLNIAIGTDGAYSNNCYDMFKEMFLVATLNKVSLYNASVVKAEEVLQMATKNGAKVLNVDNLGDIVAGNLADLILIDTTKPHSQPLYNMVSTLVYSSKSSDVYLTMVNGKILYENGEFNIGEKLDKIYNKCKIIKNRILGGN